MASTVAIWGQSCCSMPSSLTPGAAIMQWSISSMSWERCLRSPALPSSSIANCTRVRHCGTCPAGTLSPSAGMTVPSQPACSGVSPASRSSCSAMTSPLSRRWAPGFACCQSQPPHLPGPAYGHGAGARSLEGSRTVTASARRKRESASPSVTRAMTFSPGRVCRTNRTRPSAVRAMQCPPCATGPTSTSYSSPTSDCFSFCSVVMVGRLQGSDQRNGRTTDPPVYVDLVRPFAISPEPSALSRQPLAAGSFGRGASTGPRRTAPGAFHSARFLARFFASSEDCSW